MEACCRDQCQSLIAGGIAGKVPWDLKEVRYDGDISSRGSLRGLGGTVRHNRGSGGQEGPGQEWLLGFMNLYQFFCDVDSRKGDLHTLHLLFMFSRWNSGKKVGYRLYKITEVERDGDGITFTI